MAGIIMSRRQIPDSIPASIIKLNNKPISIRKELNIFGVQIDNHLTFISHIRLENAAGKLACSRCTRSALWWSILLSPGCPARRPILPSQVRNRALRLVEQETPVNEPQTHFQSLQRRRDVAVFAPSTRWTQHISTSTLLRLPSSPPRTFGTRNANIRV